VSRRPLTDPILSVVTPVDSGEGRTIAWRDGAVALWVLLKYRFIE